jgi:O-antigen/teichoic acid export membrane protein
MLERLRKNSLLSGSLIYLVSNLLNGLIPFVLLPILTRYLSPEEYGEVAMFQALMGALTAVVGLSMAGAAGRKFYDGNLSDNELKQFIGCCIQILGFTTLSTLLVLACVQSWMADWLGLSPKWIYGAAVATAATIIIQIRLGQWQVRKRSKPYGALQVSHSVFNILLSLAMVVVLFQGAGGRISAQILAVGLFALVALWLLKRDGLLQLMVWKPAYISEALKFGVPLIPHVGGIFLLSSVDRFVINAELGLADTGVYMVAVQLAGAIALIFDAINKAYVPWLFERLQRNEEREKIQIVRYTYVWFAIILMGAGLAFFLAPWLVPIVVGEEYAQAGEVLGWLVLGQVFGGMYLMVTNYIFFSKRTGLLSLVTIFSGLLNVLLLLVLIHLFGLLGAAYAFCLAMGVRFLLTWCVAQRRHAMPWFNPKHQS